MTIYLAADKDGFNLKNQVKTILEQQLDNSILEDLSLEPADDFIESSKAIVKALTSDEDSLAIAFDAYGCGSFMALNKHKGIIAAEISEERSAYMTREHNNARVITIASKTIGTELAQNIALEFIKGAYAGGRHQIRVDMLNSMC